MKRVLYACLVLLDVAGALSAVVALLLFSVWVRGHFEWDAFQKKSEYDARAFAFHHGYVDIMRITSSDPRSRLANKEGPWEHTKAALNSEQLSLTYVNLEGSGLGFYWGRGPVPGTLPEGWQRPEYRFLRVPLLFPIFLSLMIPSLAALVHIIIRISQRRGNHRKVSVTPAQTPPLQQPPPAGTAARIETCFSFATLGSPLR